MSLPPFGQKTMPRFPGYRAMFGPGIIWMALAQGSGELIWWPYLIAKYGLAFLFLLIPAVLLQYPLNYAIGRYTLLTGETIFAGFIRLHRGFALLLWILMTLSFLWFGAFAAAGGTSLAALTNFPPDASPRGKMLFWTYVSIAIYFVAILFSKVIYRLIERLMLAVTIVTVVGLLWASSTPEVMSVLPEFLRGLIRPTPLPRPWDPSDATKLLTAITFAGLGGFWTLFYSYWLREKGIGMAGYIGRITGPITGRPEAIPGSGFTPAEDPDVARETRRWSRFLIADSAIGIFGNLFTTLLTCLLAYALLYPQGILPERFEIAVVQSRFLEVAWGPVGRILFLIVAAAFLSDTWLATVDAVSRAQTDFLYSYFPWARKIPVRKWYVFFLVLFTMITSVTVLFSPEGPGPLILLSAVIGFVGTLLFSVALVLLHHTYLPRFLHPSLHPGRFALSAILLSCVIYGALALSYLYLLLVP